MTKIDIFSGFLGAGKTTLIRKLIAEGYKGEKLVLIENEFGEIAIDGGFLKDAGVQITEMNSGCICCTLVGDFTKALKKVMDDFAPDRILIEPSGVGKLSDVAAAVERVEGAHIGAKVTVVDAGKAKMYMRNFGEFFNDQVANADLIVLSRTDTASESKIQTAAELLKSLNDHAGLITTPWAGGVRRSRVRVPSSPRSRRGRGARASPSSPRRRGVRRSRVRVPPSPRSRRGRGARASPSSPRRRGVRRPRVRVPSSPRPRRGRGAPSPSSPPRRRGLCQLGHGDPAQVH